MNRIASFILRKTLGLVFLLTRLRVGALVLPVWLVCLTAVGDANGAEPAVSYIGPGLAINDNNTNLPVRLSGSTTYKVLMSFRAPKSGNLTKFRTYLQAGSGGYAAGTGGLIQAKIWPADGSTPPRPDRTGTALSTGQVQLNFVGGERSQLSDSWPLFTLTPNAPLAANQSYFVELTNIDASPSTNWVSVNVQCALNEHVTAVRHMTVSDWVVIWELVTVGVSSYIDASIEHNPSLVQSLYHFPSAEYGYSDDEYFGFIRLEPGNYYSYPYSVNSSSPVRERFNITKDTTIVGVEIHTANQTAGDLSISFIKNDVTVTTETISEVTPNYYTSGPNSNGVYEWYTIDLSPEDYFPLESGDVLDIEMVALGSAVWRMSADRTGVDAGLGLSSAATHPDSSAQKWNGTIWKNTLYYDQVGEAPFATSHFRVILKTVSSLDEPPPAPPTGLRIQ